MLNLQIETLEAGQISLAKYRSLMELLQMLQDKVQQFLQGLFGDAYVAPPPSPRFPC
jgi:hypothetical protein